ncbi:MAG: hypothetical protein JXB49_22340, partial [Bacteroidales bacterium]|nr:hypothetical protein [Bacteroidales bacterium]
MKKNLLQIGYLISFFCFFTIFCFEAQGNTNLYKMIHSFPQVANEAMVYRVASSSINEAELQKLFGMNGKMIHQDNSCKMYRNNDLSLEIFNAGSFRYTNETEIMAFTKNSKLPSKEEAVNIAKHFLTENKMMPKNAFLQNVSYTEAHTVQKGVEGSIRYRPHMCVSFGI